MAVTSVSELVVPTSYAAYIQQLTEQKSRLVESGALELTERASAKLAGGGLLFEMPSAQDLPNDADNQSTDDATTSSPNDIASSQETAVRISRNQSWSDYDLATALAGIDPVDVVANRLAKYWARRLQAAFVATWNGVIKDNVANDSGDYQNDVSSAGYNPGVTDFSAEAAIDTMVTAGDSMENFDMVMVHSAVKARMKKNNLIDTIPDARGETKIDTFQGLEVIVDDGLPVTGSVYDSWFFGRGATELGMGSPKVPWEVDRTPAAGTGGGQSTAFSRVEWLIHPAGHRYVGTAPNGGPKNDATTNNLNIATSWDRVWPERKQIRFAQLITREA